MKALGRPKSSPFFPKNQLKDFKPRDKLPGLWDIGNPGSIYSLLPDVVAEGFLDAKLKRPEFFEIDEDVLRDRIKETTGKFPSTTENQVRLRFWDEYDKHHAEGAQEKLSVAQICRGVCQTDTFYSYLRFPECAAWVACMPLTYESHLHEILNFGAYRDREIMRQSAVDPVTKKVNTKLAELQFKIRMAAEIRAYGAVPQTIKNLNLNMSEPRALQQEHEARGTITIEDKIADMERAARRIEKKPPPVEVNGETK